MEKILRYIVHFDPAEEGGYIVRVPSLPGCNTEGDTLEEAKQNAREAIALYLDSLRSHNLPIPPEDDYDKVSFVDQIAVSIG